MSPPGFIVGNLDAEADFVAATGLPRPGLSKAASEVASAAATLLRVFARSGDTLVLPTRIDSRRLTEVRGLSRPRVVAVEDLPRLQSSTEAPTPDAAASPAIPRGGPVLAWAETATVARLRRCCARQSLPAQPWPLSTALDDAVWRWPVSSPDVCRQANDRQFAWQLAQELACGLPGDCLVRTVDEWRSAVSTIAGPWVAKARFAAAGRWRLSGHSQPDAATALGVERLLARHGALRVEPWCARVRDVGVAALATPAGTQVLGAHELLVDPRGRFEGIRIRVGESVSGVPLCVATGLSASQAARLAAVAQAVGDALRRLGYSGPFGIDAWLWRPGREPADRGPVDGEPVDGEPMDCPEGLLHPLGEVNARMTFGLVAHTLVARLRDPLVLRMGDRVTLRFGRAPIPRDAQALVEPGVGGLAVWLEIERA